MANEGFSPVVPSEISDGLEIGREAFDEPHQLDNAVGFTFELARGTFLNSDKLSSAHWETPAKPPMKLARSSHQDATGLPCGGSPAVISQQLKTGCRMT